jgi:FkbM family methyltransferase
MDQDESKKDNKRSYSQYGQDIILQNYIFTNPEDKGVFLDVGAYDGIDISNTKLFEDMGWSGICIEPMPNAFAELCKNRPRSTCLNVCAYDKDGVCDYTLIRGQSWLASGIEEAYEPEHKNRIQRELKENNGTMETLKIPCMRLQTIIETYLTKGLDQQWTISFMSLDTEGSELEILKGLDFSRTRILVIVLEVNYKTSQKAKHTRAFLESNHYIPLIQCGGDVIYVYVPFAQYLYSTNEKFKSLF